MADACVIYITAGDRDEALTVARTLVDENLVACCNILGEITAVFRWEGKVQEDGEVSLIAKTRPALVDKVTEAVKRVHSYDCPCVISLPVQDGNPEFLQWIGEETGA